MSGPAELEAELSAAEAAAAEALTNLQNLRERISSHGSASSSKTVQEGAPVASLQGLTRLTVSEAADRLRPYVLESSSTRFPEPYQEDHCPPFTEVFDLVKTLKQTTQAGASTQLGRPVLLMLQTGSQSGKSRFVEELKRRQAHHNSLKTAEHSAVDRGRCCYDGAAFSLVVDLEFNGNGDEYKEADSHLAPSLFLGQRLFARGFLRCSVRQLRQVAPQAFLDSLHFEHVMHALLPRLKAEVELSEGDAAHVILSVDELQLVAISADAAGRPTFASECMDVIYEWCCSTSALPGEIRLPMLVGTGLDFFNLSLTRTKWIVKNLRLPVLTELGRDALLLSCLRQGSLSAAQAKAALQNPAVAALLVDTQGIPGAIVQLGVSVNQHIIMGYTLASHTAALRSRYEEQLKSLFHKAIDSLTATIGTGRALASLALVTMSGLTFNDSSVIMDTLTLERLQQRLGLFFALTASHNPLSHTPGAADGKVLLLQRGLFDVLAARAVGQVSIPVDQHGEYALRWAGSALEMSWSRSLQGEPFEVFVTSTLLAASQWAPPGEVRKPDTVLLMQHSQQVQPAPPSLLQTLPAMFPGGIGSRGLGAAQMVVRPLRPVRDAVHFLTDTDAGLIINQEAFPWVVALHLGVDSAADQERCKWDDTGLLFHCNTMPGDNAPLMDLRYFANVLWTPDEQSLTLVAIQIKLQDKKEPMSATKVFNNYDKLEDIVDRLCPWAQTQQAGGKQRTGECQRLDGAPQAALLALDYGHFQQEGP